MGQVTCTLFKLFNVLHFNSISLESLRKILRYKHENLSPHYEKQPPSKEFENHNLIFPVF